MLRISFFIAALGACVADAADPATETAVAAVSCTAHSCEPTVVVAGVGYRLFEETAFSPIVDGWGRTRQFYVHIPARYDSLASGEKMPVIFAFHGGGEDREYMIGGKWADYFEGDYAYVIPRGEPDPCDGPTRQWIEPGVARRSTPLQPNCTASTAVTVTQPGEPPLAGTYRDASLAEAFTDVRFVEELRAAVLARFSGLNPNKVYATGFSAGGGMSFALACYRSTLFRGFSVVAKTLDTFNVRGDYAGTGGVDPLSMYATCGVTEASSGHATGLASPDLWGTGWDRIDTGAGPVDLYGTAVRPVALFLGSNDPTHDDPDGTTAFVRAHNNLGPGYSFQNTYGVAGADDATTQRRTYTSSAGSPSAAFRRFFVTAPNNRPNQAGHAVPDVDRCTGTAAQKVMTCDYNYTDETIAFLQTQADLSLVP